MKKILKLVSLLLVIAMLLPMASVGVFAEENGEDPEQLNTEEVTAPYASLGQDVYTAGGAYYKGSPVTIDGKIGDGEGWVCVTPNGVDATVTDGVLNGVSNKVITKDDQSTLPDNIEAKYYVAQDDDYVYFVVQQTTPSDSMGNGVYISSYLRLGFNPKDYTQQVALSTGGFLSAVTITDADGNKTNTYRYDPYKVFGLYSNDKADSTKKGEATNIIDVYQVNGDFLGSDSVASHTDNGDGTYTRTYEMKLKKAAIKSEYAEVFGVDTSAIDFSAMYVGATYNGGGMYWANGTVVDDNSATANGVNTFIPDMVVFEGKDTPKAPYYKLDQEIYSTAGADYTFTPTVDGTIKDNEGWVCVTPQGVTGVSTNGFLSGASNTVITPSTVHTYDALIPTYKYYVAQTDQKIYVALEGNIPCFEEKVDGVTNSIYVYYSYLRLGFNPDNYTQQLEIFYEANTMTSIGLADNTGISTANTGSVLTKSIRTLVGTPTEDDLKPYKVYYELEFDKQAIKDAYLAQYKVTLSDDDFDAMFIGVVNRNYQYPPFGSLIQNVTYGTVLDTATATANGVNNFIPDVVHFAPIDEARAPYEIFGQSKYTTDGACYGKAPTIDGSITDNEGWVDVTPNGVDATVASRLLGKVESDTAITEVTPSDVHKNIFDQIEAKYYVAQDDDYVYVALTQQVPIESYTDPTTEIAYSLGHLSVIFTYVKLGFNSADYTQQLTFYSTGQYLTQSATKEVDGITYPTWTFYPLMLQGIGDNSAYTALSSACGIVEAPLTDSKLSYNPNASPLTRVYELKLKKSEIIAQYKEAFGEAAANAVDFSTMFIGATYSDYKYVDKDIASMYWANGTVLDTATATANGVNNFIPDIIHFAPHKDDLTEEVEAKAATCIDIGWNAHKECTLCGKKDGYVEIAPTRWDKDSLVGIGQDVYFTGTADFDLAPSIDGKIDASEGWVCVTPNKVDSYNASGAIHNESGASITANAKQYEEYHPEYKYFVSQSDKKVYLAVEQADPKTDAYASLGYASAVTGWGEYSFRIGFNPKDYTQQLVFSYSADGLLGDALALRWATDTTCEFIGTDAYASVDDEVGNIFTESASNKTLTTDESAKYERITDREFEFDKNAIKALWQEKFDVTLTDKDFNTMFVEISQKSYVTVSDGYLNLYLVYGSIASGASGAKTSLVPDMIVFGEDENADKCVCTEHVVANKYRKVGETNVYYHACKYCETAGMVTFEVDEEGNVWSEWNVEPTPTEIATGKATRNCTGGCSDEVELPTLTSDNIAVDEPTPGKYTIFTDGETYIFVRADGTEIYVLLKYVSININWGAMEFVYTNCKWNPDDLEYNIGEWAPAEEGANVITIENAGTVDVNVTFVYVSEEDFAELIGGSFTGVDGNGVVSVNVDEVKDVTLALTRKAIPDEFETTQIGTITITITEAAAQ